MFPNILHPTEDAYISQYYANSNFGGVPYLYTNRYKGSGDEYQSLLKFDWGFDGGFDDDHHHRIHRLRSQLRLKIYRNEIPSSATLLVYHVIGNWSELNVTWNNRPAIDPTPIGSVVVHAGYFGWVDINLEHFNNNLPNNGFLLKCDEPVNSLLGFYGRGFADSNLWPQLTVAGAVADDAEKPVVRVVPGPSVVLSSNLVRVPPVRDHRRRRRFDPEKRRFDRSKRRHIRC